jgi:hypothetical protein
MRTLKPVNLINLTGEFTESKKITGVEVGWQFVTTRRQKYTGGQFSASITLWNLDQLKTKH